MSMLRFVSIRPILQQQAMKAPTLRFGTLTNRWNESISHSTFQIPTWLESILWAAPKKKTSHSKKRMRASNKGLKQKENVTSCPACGSNKLLHHLCGHCYGDIKKKAKLSVE
ncbi:putative 54S ribosomal protein L32, mitochondrial [Choanephora cucurbitarum]|uniref:Large ribosomal subunit protein bL32m n=1 Tax=Choanephora cucurbitarum TaxID=101091 RepID=A0A1C7MXJ5_9FUNG|nr:putative 54S ribosomal protein L32, mitochondrial [Choanephora cucurbitarum]